MMGYEPCALPTVNSESNIPAIESCLATLDAACKEALAAHELTHQTMKARNWHTFTPFKKGDKVWLEGRNLQHSLSNPKFAAKREGPFTTTTELSPIMYKLRLPQSWNIHDTFHASLLSPYHENPVYRKNFPSPLPELLENKEHYEIEKILKHKEAPTCQQYLVHWKGYSMEEDSWLPESVFTSAKELLYNYKNSLCPCHLSC